VSNVIRLSEADASPNQKLVQGWVRSKYLEERQCYDDPANGPLPPPENTRGGAQSVPKQIFAEIPVKQVPAKYHGNWCATKSSGIYRRCRETKSEDDLLITAEMFGHESTCEPTAFTLKDGWLEVQAKCHPLDQVNDIFDATARWRLSADGRRLEEQ
jgi:hypothetical protein